MGIVLDVALKYLAEHNWSEFELRRRLEQDFGADPKQDIKINNAIKRLHELEVLDDQRVANMIASRYSHKGNKFIQHVLRQKGIDEQLIKHTLSLIDHEKNRAIEAARKRLGALKPSNSKKVEGRLSGFLNGRGFNADSLNHALQQLRQQSLV